MVTKTQGNVWVLRDFNYPKFSWDVNHMSSIKPGCSFPTIHDDFSSTLDDFGLVQMMDEPTRCGNILDLFLTSNHTLIQKIHFVPGIADHDIMAADVNVKPQITKQTLDQYPFLKKQIGKFFLSNIFRNLPLIFFLYKL